MDYKRTPNTGLLRKKKAGRFSAGFFIAYPCNILGKLRLLNMLDYSEVYLA
jgi:hypothetical protein